MRPLVQYVADAALSHLYIMRQKNEIEMLLKKFYFSTTNILTSRNEKPHMRLTVHFIKGNWETYSFCSQKAYFPYDHWGHKGSKD